ncbi:MAG TPA: sulfurtransferase [Arenimonas sp.]|uniref:sulfurtransferase n=1 Tax=Arenimonas sp. TaxID=1872635 RepID=UPI002C154EE8|nr:sulfurtransferase [Arenimonas sp.]HMB56873.1 sulfurtransferase [Arenimonas sp.]
MPILNIAAYRFVAIADPPAVVARVQELCLARELKGTVLVAPEGINIFLAGEGEAIHGFLRELAEDPSFADIPVKFSDSETIPFRRLRVRLKREIITFRDESVLPLAGRADALLPEKLRDWLRAGHDDAGRELVLLDTRNQQEVAYGSFANALTLPIDKFTQLPEALEAHRDELAGKTVVSFCTGGIRCEKAALWMHAAGYENVLQLEGGILGYFEQVGGEGYRGDCFVFDERVALSPELKARHGA